MIDDKEIDIAARAQTLSKHFNEAAYFQLRSIEDFTDGAHWAINEFLKDLWHPMQEEPKLVGEEIIIETFLDGKRNTMVQNYMVGVEFLHTIETIRWISDWDSFLAEICDDVKMIRWCYFKDLLPKEGGEQ